MFVCCKTLLNPRAFYQTEQTESQVFAYLCGIWRLVPFYDMTRLPFSEFDDGWLVFKRISLLKNTDDSVPSLGG